MTVSVGRVSPPAWGKKAAVAPGALTLWMCHDLQFFGWGWWKKGALSMENFTLLKKKPSKLEQQSAEAHQLNPSHR